MAVINQLLTEVTHIVARAAAAEDSSSTTTSSAAQASETENRDNNNNNNNNNGSSSPLLFFVALGFGVVFTNLWIIVGVKYCFRYNARNRAMRMNEDGEPITLENMPRPHRRRREKKLMTMDEVNDKFPMMKYKTWVSDRAREGLPTTGGVSAPPTRPNSIREADGIVPDFSAKERDSTDGPPSTRAVAAKGEGEATGANETAETPAPTTTAAVVADSKPKDEKPKETPATTTETGQTSTEQTTNNNHLQRVSSEDTDDDDDDHIDGALPPECLEAPGDTCAICIDTLEDDDDVRGLTCGHAFHAVCLDPWLTSRRACCPLCKADYYVPKPRPVPEASNDAAANNGSSFDPRNNPRFNLPAAIRSAWVRGPRSAQNATPSSEAPQRRRSERRPEGAEQATQPDQTQQTTEAPRTSNGGVLSSVRGAFRFGRRRQDQPPSQSNGTAEIATPSQLEAANRPTAAAQ
ncbi:hypothetical protein N0V84_012444 [Fusarium piperis]|uniref:RING-type domain-containing protein n=1 Tax=Fusarium piperis TaxID=1435070 RepID=A0A9W8W2Q4_9HYPO|nr:hypothetical protein N0V84_012444 [Fusarium piperis]